MMFYVIGKRAGDGLFNITWQKNPAIFNISMSSVDWNSRTTSSLLLPFSHTQAANILQYYDHIPNYSIPHDSEMT